MIGPNFKEAKSHNNTIALYNNVAQRLNNPYTPNQAVFENNPHSQTRNQLAANPQSC